MSILRPAGDFDTTYAQDLKTIRQPWQWVLLLFFILALYALLLAPQDPGHNGCSFIPVQEPTDVVRDCAVRHSDGRLVIKRDALAHVNFGADGVVGVIVNKVLLFVTPEGRTAPALYQDNREASTPSWLGASGAYAQC